MTELDNNDLAIMRAIEDYGPKISSEELSIILNKEGFDIPSRTIRYHIQKLKKKGYLKPVKMKTHERKLGCGESICLLNVNQKMETKLLYIFEQIPYIYIYGSTYGKYNGYLIRSIFSLETPNIIFELLDAMKRIGYISDYFVFELLDYRIKNKDLTYFNREQGWIYNWEDWYNSINETMRKKEVKFEFNIEPDVEQVEFDYKDILLLKHMWEDASITLKELKEVLELSNVQLSEAQISKRIQKLEEKDIIKGYYLDYSLLKSEDFIYFYCFFETGEVINKILSCLFKLPYSFTINIETTNKLCLSIGLSASDFQKFLKGFDLLRPYLHSYFFQFTYSGVKSSAQYLFDLFNRKTSSWETPVKDYISLIEKEIEK
ncbi:MAG: winged-helix domain-containing protein [Promethearchaeota archaeon]